MVMLLLIISLCSPLFHLLEALVSITIVDGDRDLVNDAHLLLLSIFRAIKKAEDVVDAQNTPVRIVYHRFSRVHHILC
jgi:sister-chromatid-cohesion protein PDS5